MIINHNLSALNIFNRRSKNARLHISSLEKLSSGKRINKAADDAAGLAISEKMRAQIRGLRQAERNIQDGISLIQTAEGGLANIQDPPLQRMRELAIEAGNDTLTDQDRQMIQKEIEQIKQGINEIALNTEFNDINLLSSRELYTTHHHKYEAVEMTMTWTQAKAYCESNGGYLATITSAEELAEVMNAVASSTGSNFWLGATDAHNEYDWKWITGEDFIYTNWNTGEPNNVGNEDYMAMYRSGYWNDLPNISRDAFIMESEYDVYHLGESSKLNFQVSPNPGSFQIQLSDVRTTTLGIDDISVLSHSQANQALNKIDKALQTISSERAKYGAYQNRLEYTLNYTTNYESNLTASMSRIVDTDMAKETMEMTKRALFSQVSNAMLAQSNKQPQQILQLLDH